MGILEDIHIKVGDFYVHIDFVVLDMAEDCRTQIILGRPFLATAGCKIDVKEGRLTFDVQEVDPNFEFEFGSFDDDGPKIRVLLDPILWKLIRSKKDINPELLRWFLLL